MKSTLRITILQAGYWALLLLLSQGLQAQKEKKVLFVIVDGIAADVIEKLPMPHLDKMAAKGGYARAYVGGEKGGYSQTPTISAVGYNSLLTGTWVHKHNVWDNHIKAPNYQYWSIFRFFSEQYPHKKTAVFSSWLDNRTRLVGEGLATTGHLQLTHHYDGLELDTVQFPHDADKYYMHRIDEAVVNHASAYIKSEAPHLSWVYLEYTDDMGHRYGDGPEFYKAVELMDKQMDRLWAAINYRQKHFKEDWAVFITTDHGRDAATGKNHGGQSDRERSTWIVTNTSRINSHFKSGQAAIVDIFPAMARHLDIAIPRHQRMELDGISITGRVAARQPAATYQNGKIKLSWQALRKAGTIKVWLSTTNNFKEGGQDAYVLVATLPLQAQQGVIDVSQYPSRFYKVVLETPDNFLNRWVLLP